MGTLITVDFKAAKAERSAKDQHARLRDAAHRLQEALDSQKAEVDHFQETVGQLSDNFDRLNESVDRFSDQLQSTRAEALSKRRAHILRVNQMIEDALKRITE